jgi:threonine synthase
MGFQAAGAAPIVQGKPIEKPKTIATAIRIGNPASWKEATTARDASGGVIDSVTDDEIIAAYRFLASKEGIFGEPASAAPIAGIFKAVRQGLKLKNKRVVCIITGSGLKDPSLPTKFVETFKQLPPDLPAIERELGLV